MRTKLGWARRIVSLLLVAGLVAGSVPGSAGAAEPKEKKHWWNSQPWSEGEPFHWDGRVPAGGTVEVKNINGGIRAVLATGNEVVVDATKRGKKDDPDAVQIDVTQEGNRLIICARYPSPSGDLNDCESQNIQDFDVNVEFEIQVPAGLRFEPQTVNGGIEVVNLKGAVEATTVNGSVEVSTTGSAEVHTVNGSITAVLGKLDGDLEFETVNGAIEVSLPARSNFDLDARAANGSIDTDLAVAVSGRVKRNHLKGQVGSGGPNLRLSTVNGGITLNVD